jgi:hypothetical protein
LNVKTVIKLFYGLRRRRHNRKSRYQHVFLYDDFTQQNKEGEELFGVSERETAHKLRLGMYVRAYFMIIVFLLCDGERKLRSALHSSLEFSGALNVVLLLLSRSPLPRKINLTCRRRQRQKPKAIYIKNYIASDATVTRSNKTSTFDFYDIFTIVIKLSKLWSENFHCHRRVGGGFVLFATVSLRKALPARQFLNDSRVGEDVKAKV